MTPEEIINRLAAVEASQKLITAQYDRVAKDMEHLHDCIHRLERAMISTDVALDGKPMGTMPRLSLMVSEHEDKWNKRWLDIDLRWKKVYWIAIGIIVANLFSGVVSLSAFSDLDRIIKILGK